jgi:hypothetical protein
MFFYGFLNIYLVYFDIILRASFLAIFLSSTISSIHSWFGKGGFGGWGIFVVKFVMVGWFFQLLLCCTMYIIFHTS